MNKVFSILVTGATGLLGQSIVETLLGDGHTVVAISRSIDESFFSNLSSCNERLRLEQLDLTDYGAISRLSEKLAEEGFNCQIIIHAARTISKYEFETSGQQTTNNFSLDVSTTITAAYKLALSFSSKHPLQHILNIGSQYGTVVSAPNLYDDHSIESPPSYATAKAGVFHVTKELAVRLAPSVRVNAISLGGLYGRATEDFVKRYEAISLRDRMIPVQVATDAICALAIGPFDPMTGNIINLDDGWTLI